MIQTKYIRLGEYKGTPCTEIVHWGSRVIAVFPEITPEQLFRNDEMAKEFLKIIETTYLREKFELLQSSTIKLISSTQLNTIVK